MWLTLAWSNIGLSNSTPLAYARLLLFWSFVYTNIPSHCSTSPILCYWEWEMLKSLSSHKCLCYCLILSALIFSTRLLRLPFSVPQEKPDTAFLQKRSTSRQESEGACEASVTHRYVYTPRVTLKQVAVSPALLNWESAPSRPTLSLISSVLVSLSELSSDYLLETRMCPRLFCNNLGWLVSLSWMVSQTGLTSFTTGNG